MEPPKKKIRIGEGLEENEHEDIASSSLKDGDQENLKKEEVKEADAEADHVEGSTSAAEATDIETKGKEGGFTVVVQQLSGAELLVPGLLPSSTLNELRLKISERVGKPSSGVKLVREGVPFSPQDRSKTLSALNICDGAHLMLIIMPLLTIEPGLRVEVQEAGTVAVNGVYVNGRNGLEKQGRGRGAILHFEDASDWPGGWYMSSMHRYRANYFIETDDKTLLPLTGWRVYDGEMSDPGDMPEPTIVLA